MSEQETHDLEIHERWIADYRSPANEAFYALAFDDIAAQCPGDGLVLDAGCGSGTKTVLLAARGLNVVGVDLSPTMVERANAMLSRRGFRATCHPGDLTALAFPDGHFSHVVCHGVLMHIPDVEKALSELFRVTAPGGSIILSENTRYGLEPFAVLALRRWIGQDVRTVPSGVEHWEATPSGPFVTRFLDARWLTRYCGRAGVEVINRRAGEFTTLFNRVPSWAKPLLHRFNRIWYRRITWAGPAACQIVVCRKA